MDSGSKPAPAKAGGLNDGLQTVVTFLKAAGMYKFALASWILRVLTCGGTIVKMSTEI